MTCLLSVKGGVGVGGRVLCAAPTPTPVHVMKGVVRYV
ncbi:hypothetical protein BH11ACT6_BH11ACT6_53470 [soil metagenome]